LAEPVGLLVDWGGVMTTNLFGSFDRFCEAEGLDRGAIATAFRHDPDARELLVALEEGRMEPADFEPRFATMLGLSPERHSGMIARLFEGSALDDAMIDAVRRARGAGVRTGLISNSWGLDSYPRDLLGELFDGVVISGEVGLRKPAARIYELGAEAIGLEPAACVFVDDLPFNLTPAAEMGMRTIRHVSADETIPELEAALAVSLAP